MVELMQQANLSDNEVVHYAQYSDNPTIRRLSDIVESVKEENVRKDAQINEYLSVLTERNHEMFLLEYERDSAKEKMLALREEMQNIRNTKKTTLIDQNKKQAEEIKELTKRLREMEARMNTWTIMSK